MLDKKIVFILGLGHTGTTLMEYYLSTYKGNIGIGEAYKAVRSFREGEIDTLSKYDRNTIKSSSFWSQILSGTDSYNSLEEQYVDLFSYINNADQFSEYDTIIDSSKSMEALRLLNKNFPENVSVVVMIKDVRSWIVSQYNNNRRKNRKIPIGYNFKLLLKWFRAYMRMKDNLDSLKVNYTIIPYDVFCLNRDAIEAQLQERFNLKGEPDFSNTNSINILGNRMKKEANKELKIRYDYKWMKSNEWSLPWFFVPKRMKEFNYKFVWSDTLIHGNF